MIFRTFYVYFIIEGNEISINDGINNLMYPLNLAKIDKILYFTDLTKDFDSCKCLNNRICGE